MMLPKVSEFKYLYFYMTKLFFVFVPGSRYEKPAEVVINIIGDENNLLQVEKMIPIIVDVLSLYVSNVTEKEDVALAKYSLTALNTLLSSSMKLLTLRKDTVSHAYLLTNFESDTDFLF